MVLFLARAVLVALVATIGDFIWFEYGVRHTTLHGILHGAALLSAVGLVLGHQAGALGKGAIGGICAGVAGALAFYAVVGLLGYLGALIAAWVAANGVPLREPLKPMPPALDHAITLPSVSVIVICVLLNEAWMCTSP